jgi:hypothetical protein
LTLPRLEGPPSFHEEGATDDRRGVESDRVAREDAQVLVRRRAPSSRVEVFERLPNVRRGSAHPARSRADVAGCRRRHRHDSEGAASRPVARGRSAPSTRRRRGAPGFAPGRGCGAPCRAARRPHRERREEVVRRDQIDQRRAKGRHRAVPRTYRGGPDRRRRMAEKDDGGINAEASGQCNGRATRCVGRARRARRPGSRSACKTPSNGARRRPPLESRT